MDDSNGSGPSSAEAAIDADDDHADDELGSDSDGMSSEGEQDPSSVEALEPADVDVGITPEEAAELAELAAGASTLGVGPASGHAVGWTRPLAGYRVAQEFRGVNVHNGIDLAKAYGSVVYAAHAGKVTQIIRGYCKAGYRCAGTGRNWALDRRYFMSGDKVVVTHTDGKKTIYDHTGSSGLSYVGMKVRTDTPIGRINHTGNRTGAHLHFAVMVNGRLVNPRNYVRF